MGSRALFVRCVNQLINNNSSCKYISSTAALGKDSALQIQKTPEDFFLSAAEKARSKALRGEITVEGEKNMVGLTSGVPEEHIKTRTVRIYQPTKNAMQSGTHNVQGWQICFDTRERWENPLMGWCSSGDPLQATRVNFESEEEAIRHCENMGWNYVVQQPNKNDPKPRSYGTNFSWDKRTRVSTK